MLEAPSKTLMKQIIDGLKEKKELSGVDKTVYPGQMKVEIQS